MKSKDQMLLEEAYQITKEREYLKENNSFDTFINIGLARFYKKVLLEYTNQDKVPSGKENINLTGDNSTNPYEPTNVRLGTNTAGDEIEIHGTNREMDIEKSAIEATRALMIFLTFARIDPIVRSWLNVFKIQSVSTPLEPNEVAELANLNDKIKRTYGLPVHQALNKQEHERFIELSRKQNKETLEYAAPEKDRVVAQEKILKRLKRLTKDQELQEELEDIVDYMISFLGTNPNALEMLDLPKYIQDNKPSQDINVASPQLSDISSALPAVLNSAIQIFNTAGSTAVEGGAFLGRRALGLMKYLKDKPKKALALLMGSKVKPAPALPDKQKENNSERSTWEIETSNGHFEPLSLTDK
jgi:hypothetical protein